MLTLYRPTPYQIPLCPPARPGWPASLSGPLLAGLLLLLSLSTQAQFTQSQKLTPLTGQRQQFAGFGQAVAIDGNVMVVGAYGDDTSSGAVYVYEKSGGSWTQTARLVLVASDRAAFDLFSFSVAVSGTTIVVGAPQEDEDAGGGNTLENAGSAYVFEKVQGTWQQTAKLVASDRAANDNFGNSVAVSGTTIVVGAPQEDEDAGGINTLSAAGSAYVFEKNGTWQQTAKLVASDRAANDNFGNSVAISGSTLVVGAPQASGSAYVFEKSGTWQQTQKLVASDRAQGDNFGYSVAISGSTLVVGAWLEDEDASGGNTLSAAGSAYVFEKNGTWQQTAKLVASDRAANDNFGNSVAVSGTTIVVGAPQEDEDAGGINTLSAAGSAYVFEKNGTWQQTAKLVASDRAQGDNFGYSVAVSGTAIVVGANAEDQDASGGNTLSGAGSAYVFSSCAPPTAYTVTGGGSYCAGGSGVAIGLSGSESGISYQLKDGNGPVGSPVAGTGNALDFGLFTTAGTYSVLASRSETCTATMTASASVSINPLPTPSITPGGETAFCSGDSVLLSTGSFSSYLWKKDGSEVGSGATYSAIASGSYTVTVTDANGCVGTSSPVTVTVFANPVLGVTASPNPVCVGSQLTLTATVSGGAGSYTYVWSGPNAFSSFVNIARRTVVATDGGVYSVVVTDANRCQASGQTPSVSITPLPTTLPAPTLAGAVICAGQPFTLGVASVECVSGLTAQLSDKAGDFTTPTASWAVSAGSNSLTLPLGLPSGTGYHIRLVSSSPALTSASSAAFTVNALGSVGVQMPTTAAKICQGEALPVTFSTTGTCPFPLDNVFTLQLSSATGSFANPTSLGPVLVGVSNSVALPSGLAAGSGYRVRIVSSLPAQTSPASASFQVVGPSLSVTPTVGGAPVCRGLANALTVSFTLPSGSCPFPGGNTFTAQLSSATGSFNNPTSLGSVLAGVPNTLTIPAGIATGSGYRIRIVSSSPAFTSSNSSLFQVKVCPTRMSAEVVELVIAPNPVVGTEIRCRVSGMDSPAFSLTTSGGRSLSVAVNTDGGGEFVLTPRQVLTTGVYLLQASEGKTRLTRRVLIVE